MCRIAGIINHEGIPDQLAEDVTAMCNIMKNGGPDDEGFYADEVAGLQFGHRRLALIDLSSSGHQPMLDQDQNFAVTYNGEIYNYQEIKAELQNSGLNFSTQSDTEVILLAYKKWGTDSFKKLKGMFAFAIYDKTKQLTYLVRDQSGIKPLYYSVKNKQLIFASEIKAFKNISEKFNEDPDWKTYFLAFGHIPHPFTTLKQVNSLPAGHYLKWNHLDQIFQLSTFVSNENITKKNQGDVVNQVAIELDEAVKNHLIADAEVGVFLSGGIDSSIITLLADKEVGKNLKSLSINFTEEAFAEAKFQRLIAEKTTGTHHTYTVTKKDFDTHFDQIMAAMDQPTNDGVNSWFVNKFAKENELKAVLSGIGADELYGGYPSFKRIGILKALKRLPKSILKLSAKLPSDRLKRIYYLSYQNPIGEYLFLRGFFNPLDIANVLNLNLAQVDQLFEKFPIDQSVENLTGEERISWFETNLFMQNQLLKDTDFMSMSHGVEVRVPFLDQDFLAITSQIPSVLRFPKKPKGLLIEAFKKILPEAIWNRPKMGFSFPLQDWFLSGGQITEENIYADHHHSLNLIRKFKEGKMHWSKAFALYQIHRKNQ